MYRCRILRKGFTALAVLLLSYAGIKFVPWGSTTSSVAFGDHPEQMVRLKEKEKSIITLEDVVQFAEEYIQKNSRDGMFKLYDKKTKKELELKLEKVHRERLSPVKKDEYVVCADFQGKDGNTYDLDFFVQGKTKSYFTIDKKDISIHKVNGKEKYTWSYHEKKNVWVKKIMETEKKQPEQTTYPKPDYP